MPLIKVTQKHIDKGEAGYVAQCPIALALREAGYKRAGVSLGRWSYEDGHSPRIMHKNTHSMSRFVRRFDRGLPVVPFTFRV